MKHLISLPVFNPADPPAPAPAPAAAPAPAPAPEPAAAPAPAPTAAPSATQPPAPNALANTPADKQQAPAADWVPDWRERFAAASSPDGKPDPKVVDRLKRYDSPVAFAKAGLEAQNRILSGKVAEDVPMPDPTKDADGAKKWREERGIPVDPTGYKLPDDVTKALAPEDAPVLANFTAYAHANNMTPKQVEQSVKWYAGLVEEQRQAEEAIDKSSAEATEDHLRRTWGEGFRDNHNLAKKFAEEAVPNVGFFYARLPNDPAKYGENAGKMLGNIPSVAEAFAQLGLLKFGDISFAGGEAAKATEDEIKSLKNLMDTNIDEWNASPDKRKRYFELLEKQQKRPGQQG